MAKAKKHYSGIGGQAVLEGIMMKNKTRYAVAVRKPDGEIDVEISEYKGILGDSKIMKIPFVRGIFAFVDSLVLGTRTLNHSASFYEEEVTETKSEEIIKKVFKDKAENILVGFTTVLSIVLAVAIFMVLPYVITSQFLEPYIRNASLLAIIEGIMRIAIFVLYTVLISLMKDIRRVFMYHGAEHKCINCIEKGRPLTIRNVMRSSKQHKRCGTSFMLFVMVISVVLFFFIRVDNMALKVVYRILLIPVIAGIAYEIIRLAGNSENILVRIISAPGMWLQRLTTKEPDEDMVEVAIQAVEAVFDWKAYQTEVFGYTEKDFENELIAEENLKNEETIDAVSEEETEPADYEIEDEVLSEEDIEIDDEILSVEDIEIDEDEV